MFHFILTVHDLTLPTVTTFFSFPIAQHPAIDHIPAEYQDHLVELIDTESVDVEFCAKFVRNAHFWKKMCLTRWGAAVDLSEHGNVWKRCYLEKHLQESLERFVESHDDVNMDQLQKTVNACRPHVQLLKVEQLLSHIDLYDVLQEFPHLTHMRIKYGSKTLGMEYDPTLLGATDEDCQRLATLIANSCALVHLDLSENLLNSQRVAWLLEGIARNCTLAVVNFSHNDVDDEGARALHEAFKSQGMMHVIRVDGNNIREEGAKEFAQLIKDNGTIDELSLQVNPIGDIGGAAILDAVAGSSATTVVHLGSCQLGNKSADALVRVIRNNPFVEEISLSGNNISTEKAVEILHALEEAHDRSSLHTLDLRLNPISEDVLSDIKILLRAKKVEIKRARRHLLQENSWDEVQ